MTAVSVELSLQQLISQRGLVPQYAKDKEPLPEHTVVRERFANRREFVLTFIGYVVGPHNVWRFPYLVLKNKGAVFVLLYVVVAFLVGIPVSYLELALGQYSGKNTIMVWDLSPAFRGVGFSFIVVCWLTSLNFQLIMAHCLLYVAQSIGHQLTWTRCKPEWLECYVEVSDLKNWTIEHNFTHCFRDLLIYPCICHEQFSPKNCVERPRSASEFFYYEEILQIQKNSRPVTQFGKPPWKVALVLLFSWILVILCVLRGIRYTTKFLYVSVLLPYLGLLFLLGHQAAEKGASEGLQFFLGLDHIEWSELTHSKIWVDAFSQAFFSINTILGELFIIGSYMHFRNKYLHWDLLIVTIADVLTSLLFALLVCLALGHTAYIAGFDNSFRLFISSDLAISFITFPAILASLPMTYIFSAIFFVMLYSLAIDTEFGLVETVLTYLQDDFRLIRRNTVKARILFGTFCYLISLVLICPGGYSLVKLIDDAVYSMCLPVLGLIEVCVIMWGYGVKRFLSDLEYMLAIKLKGYYIIAFHLAVFLPISLMGLVIMSFVQFIMAGKQRTSKVAMILFILSPVPIWFLLYARKIHQKYPELRWAKMWSKLIEPHHMWAPNDGSNIHRSTNTVFAELFDCLKTNVGQSQLKASGGDYFTNPISTSGKWMGDLFFDSIFMDRLDTGPGEDPRCNSLPRMDDYQPQTTTKERRNTVPCGFRLTEFSSQPGPSSSVQAPKT